MHTPKEYFEKIVQENYKQFEKTGDLRSSINFAMTAFHLHEWVYHFHKGNPEKTFRTKDEKDYAAILCKQYPNFKWIREITLLYKHCERRSNDSIIPDNSKVIYKDRMKCTDRINVRLGGVQRLAIEGWPPFDDIFFGVMHMWYKLFEEFDL